MYKEPNWTRLENERFKRDMELYESQLTEPKRCEECDKIMGDEEQCQPICELCSAGVPCVHEDNPCQYCGYVSDEDMGADRPINRPSELGM